MFNFRDSPMGEEAGIWGAANEISKGLKGFLKLARGDTPTMTPDCRVCRGSLDSLGSSPNSLWIVQHGGVHNSSPHSARHH